MGGGGGVGGGRRGSAETLSSNVSEGIQNVIFNLTNTSVVPVLRHAAPTELRLPKA